MLSYREHKLKQLLSEDQINEFGDLTQQNFGAAGQRAINKSATNLTPGKYSAAKGAGILANTLKSIVEGDPKAEWKMRRIAYLLNQAVRSGNLAIASQDPQDQQA